MAALLTLICTETEVGAQAHTSIVPMPAGTNLTYTCKDAGGKLQATYRMKVLTSQGDPKNWTVSMTYSCFDEKGKPYFDGTNEVKMKLSRVNGQTATEMDELLKAAKIQDLTPIGDPTTIPDNLTVGQTIPNSTITVHISKVNATRTVTERVVKDHKTITTKAGSFDCYLVHEKVVTKTPLGTSTQSADTWYTGTIGSVKQTIYDGKGKLKGTQELTSK